MVHFVLEDPRWSPSSKWSCWTAKGDHGDRQERHPEINVVGRYRKKQPRYNSVIRRLVWFFSEAECGGNDTCVWRGDNRIRHLFVRVKAKGQFSPRLNPLAAVKPMDNGNGMDKRRTKVASNDGSSATESRTSRVASNVSTHEEQMKSAEKLGG